MSRRTKCRKCGQRIVKAITSQGLIFLVHEGGVGCPELEEETSV